MVERGDGKLVHSKTVEIKEGGGVVGWSIVRRIVEWFIVRRMVEWFIVRWIVEWFIVRRMVEWFIPRRMVERRDSTGRVEWMVVMVEGGGGSFRCYLYKRSER